MKQQQSGHATVFVGILCNKKPLREVIVRFLAHGQSRAHIDLRYSQPTTRRACPRAVPHFILYILHTRAHAHQLNHKHETATAPFHIEPNTRARHSAKSIQPPRSSSRVGRGRWRASEVCPEPQPLRWGSVTRCRLKLGYLCNACVSVCIP